MLKTCFEIFEKREIIETYLRRQNGPLSSYSFVSIFAWSEFFKFDFELIDDCLCVFAENELGAFMFLPPLGENIGAPVIGKCFERMAQVNGTSNVARIENAGRRHLHHFSSDKFSLYKKHYEFLYYKDDIAGLSGSKYKTKRSGYNNFVKNNDFRFVAFDASLRNDCLELYDRWALGRKSGSGQEAGDQMLDECREVNRLLLDNSEDLGLIARVVLIDGKVSAYTFGFEVTDQVFCVFSEIVDLDVKGLSVFIFNEFCKDRDLKQYKFINVMDDFELENIGRTKMSFNPAVLLDSYSISLK
ncbi:MAG: DUF2156 domain-containing protein [Candidatus Omnitrophica bacterium]|nr:DUF2156 domain-containing protein [Candidatus Omnitrophota bacterium]MBU4334768.1 DUF2156 domain-containing protein [Candidatus Omnitrophota bacterium]